MNEPLYANPPSGPKLVRFDLEYGPRSLQKDMFYFRIIQPSTQRAKTLLRWSRAEAKSMNTQKG